MVLSGLNERRESNTIFPFLSYLYAVFAHRLYVVPLGLLLTEHKNYSIAIKKKNLHNIEKQVEPVKTNNNTICKSTYTIYKNKLSFINRKRLK